MAVQRLVAKAIRSHEAGRLEEARQLYLRVLAIEARHARSLYGLGLIGQASGDSEDAVRRFREAIAVCPNDAAYHTSLGGSLQAQRKIDEADSEYRQALRLDPNYALAHNNFAGLLQHAGKFEEAKLHYERAIALKPDFAAAYSNLGTVLLNLNGLAAAVACQQKALALKPDLVEAHNNLSLVLRKLGRLEEAATHYERAVALRPNYVEAWSNFGVLLRQQGKLEESAACLVKALNLRPNSAEAFDNLGNTLRDMGRLVESAACHERALALKPDFAQAHNNLGYTLRKQGKLAESRESYQRALVLDPGSPDIRWNLCLLDLLEGNFAEGWRHYEVRFQREGNRPRSFSKPIWCGEPLNGARILLHSEQGLGDAIQFLRYIPLVHAAGGTVILNVPRALGRLAASLPGVDTLTVEDESLPPFDWHCPLMSLPLAFKTSLDSIPNRVPYLTVPKEALQRLNDLHGTNRELRIGLVWSGNPKCTEDQIRSMPLSSFRSVLELDGLRFFSLQLGAAAAQLGTIETPITDLSSAINDMADTAALVMGLDLIITVDTSVAHLAGALGKPTWTLIPFAPDWRWLTDREDSPWYPTMRLFRQDHFGDWESVVQSIRVQLSALAARHG
ncbi:MAG TPA: tetratricopeptide repeat protein [Acidobacteriaceae bacterium]|nr:tetratricopeptide repeat protein [Acidobacteriaceae bacterium]